MLAMQADLDFSEELFNGQRFFLNDWLKLFERMVISSERLTQTIWTVGGFFWTDTQAIQTDGDSSHLNRWTVNGWSMEFHFKQEPVCLRFCMSGCIWWSTNISVRLQQNVQQCPGILGLVLWKAVVLPIRGSLTISFVVCLGQTLSVQWKSVSRNLLFMSVTKRVWDHYPVWVPIWRVP